MDTPASGGMAPALRSTNHQSTDLVKKEANTNGLPDILPLEKINGSAHDGEHITQVSDLVKPRPDIPNVKNDYAAGDGIAVNGPTEQSMTVTEAYLLNVPKAAPQPSISASRPHIGQGDCPASVTVSQNGWNNYKKSVLQENNNSSCKMCHTGKNSTRTERSAYPVGSMKTEKTQERSNENCHNGGITTETNCATPQMGSTSTSTTMTFTSATSKSALLNTNSGYSPSVLQTSETSSSVTSSACSNVKPGQFGSGDCLTAGVGLKGSQDGVDFTSSSPLPQVLKYTDLLSDDLSKINVPDKLAHTLQELAASLKGATLQRFGPAQMQTLSQDRNSTVKQEDQERPCRSVKSLDFNVSEQRGPEDMKKSLQLKLKDAEANATNLQNRLISLKSRVDFVRLRGVEQYAKRDIRHVVSAAVPCSSRSEPKHVNTEKWDDEIIDITNDCSSTMQNGKENRDSTLKFWQKILEKQNKRSLNQYPSSTNVPRESPQLENTSTPTACDHRSISPELHGVNLDPIVQLTRVEHREAQKTDKAALMKKAKANSGVLLKELKYMRSHHDPEVTDSSSDDEIPDTYGETRKHPVTARTGSQGPAVSRNNRGRKSFCRWVAERAEISRRWTWLQSRISNLEFSIRQQGDLYRKLRAGKGVLRLDYAPKPPATKPVFHDVAPETTPASSLSGRHAGAPLGSTVPEGMLSSASPCNLNDLLSNVRNQTSRIFDNLSPLSGGSPSQSQVLHESPLVPTGSGAESAVSQQQSSAQRVTNPAVACARAKPICLTDFKRRKLVKFVPLYQRSEKPLKQRTVPNDSSIMKSEGKALQRNSLTAYQSVALKAAVHDHSYHVVISSMTDIPLSMTTQALMKSKRKWCKKSTSPAKIGGEGKNAQHVKHARKKGKQKKKKQKKNSNNMLPPNYSADDHGGKRKRYTSQVSQQSDSSRKRQRGLSFDSDFESSMLVGTSHHPSRSTPTHDASQQSYWRKKKSSEQAYDINNIVIPHGLNSARIEKLAYKEIQTPSWKLVELNPELADFTASEDVVAVKDEEFEDITYGAFQRRHDRYEILEKKKYMAYMEWSISRKGRGSRMSNIGGVATPEPASPASPSCTPSPVPFTVEGPHVLTPCIADDQARTSADPPSPTAGGQSGGVRTRRMSAEQNPGRPTTPLSHFHQNHTDTSLGHSFSSPTLACWQDGLGSRRASAERAAPVNRTMSEGSGIRKNSEQYMESWEVRTFPLQGEDLLILEDLDFAAQRQRLESSISVSHVLADGDDGGKARCFRPVSRQNSADYDRATHSLPDQNGKTLSTEALQDHQRLQATKSGALKRRRTDSRASSLASYDDTGRHSDASNASASSAYKRRKKVGTARSRAGSHHGHEAVSQKRHRDSMSRAARLKHTCLQLRLSETEDSSSDTDSDESRTSDGTSTSFDDAGHIVDDFADPEWDFNASRHRDRR